MSVYLSVHDTPVDRLCKNGWLYHKTISPPGSLRSGFLVQNVVQKFCQGHFKHGSGGYNFLKGLKGTPCDEAKYSFTSNYKCM